MLRLIFISLFLFVQSLLPAQVSISYCPDLGTLYLPESIAVGENYGIIKHGCGRTCRAGCELVFHDPIGGFTIGYFSRLDEDSTRWVFEYTTGQIGDGAQLKEQMTRFVDQNRFKLSAKGISVFEVPINRTLLTNKVEDEIQKLALDSFLGFENTRKESRPLGDLAGVFSEMVAREGFVYLSTQYVRPDNPKSSYALDFMSAVIKAALPEYNGIYVNDSTRIIAKNNEYPRFTIEVRPSERIMRWICYAPEKKEPPQLFVAKFTTKSSTSECDTLVSTMVRGKTKGYRFAVVDESPLKEVKFNGNPLSFEGSVDTTWFFVPYDNALNRTKIKLEAQDVHGNSMVKDLFLTNH